MLNLILALKFLHMVTMAVMFGTWLGIALFMLFAHRMGHASVVALISAFVVRAQTWVMAVVVILQPLIGVPLSLAIGSSMSAYWLEVSVAIYAAVVLVWMGGLLVEMRIRRLSVRLSKDPAATKTPLPPSYRRLFWVWSVLTVVGLGGMIAIMALMVWQPEWS
jgi:uncharacterized membrane protein